MVGHRCEREELARKMKCADLAPALGQELGGADSAANDIIDVFRRLSLSVDFLVLPIGELSRHQTGMSGQGTEVVGAGERDRSSLGTGNGGVERLGEH